jgi:hypothetical protein
MRQVLFKYVMCMYLACFISRETFKGSIPARNNPLLADDYRVSYSSRVEWLNQIFLTELARDISLLQIRRRDASIDRASH